ncbi:sialate O-acetylesterase [Candidatus Laterigemmans baculatus]|uniref:sialate O-acetylesterase n=1 Tax=Candidatus Laterigemmans baculatus TaxID=2770505 RepID=UPI0013DCA57D|nr:sialate O-acetylesterase [Candidatus Laterigemmans baculatus]
MKPYHLLLSLLLALVLIAGARAQESNGVDLPAKENLHLFLLIGQSNMAGRGKVSDQDRQPHRRVLMLNQDGQWVPAVDPLHFDKPTIVGVGPGRTFGIEVAEAMPNITVGLIPCAVGGSAIAGWEPGGFDAPTKTHPYDDMLVRAKKALEAGTLKGILWHQGESDASDEKSAVYEEKLHALVKRLREEFNAPHVPFIAGQLGQFPERPWNEAKKRVDQVHRELPHKLPNTAFVSAEGLTHKGDQVHFDAASAKELGRRYAEAYLKMVNTTR